MGDERILCSVVSSIPEVHTHPVLVNWNVFGNRVSTDAIKHKGIAVLSWSVRNVDTTTVEDSCAKVKAGSVMTCAQVTGAETFSDLEREKSLPIRLQGRLPMP